VFRDGDQAQDWNRVADLTSISFAMENLFVGARAKGLGTVPTVFHWFVDDAFRELLAIPDELEIPLMTPLGYPEEFPVGLPPALKAARRPWRTLVHDERWGNPRQAPATGR
jgi:nitroreductase